MKTYEAMQNQSQHSANAAGSKLPQSKGIYKTGKTAGGKASVKQSQLK